jgi:rare lipoprotein A
VLLVPIMYLHGDAGGPSPPEFDMSAAPTATWLEPRRIVVDETSFASAPRPPAEPTTTTTLSASTSSAGTPTTGATKGGAVLSSAPPTTTTTSRPAPKLPVVINLPSLPLGGLTPAEKPFGTHADRGVASWFNAPDGTCAHRTLAVGTVVRVTRLHNGATTTCVVDQGGPEDTTRVIDLSMDTFEKLAYPEAGLIDVLIEW